MLSYLALELRRGLRDRRFLILVVGWPVGSYLLFSAVFGSQPADPTTGLRPKVMIMVAMAAFGAMGAVLSSTGPRLAVDRQLGWLRQLRLTPLSPAKVLTARTLAALCLTLPAICLTFAVAAAVNGVRLDAWQWPALVLVVGVGCVPFAAIGMVIGSAADGDSAQGLTMVAYLVLAALGGLWMPVSILPTPLQTIAHSLPSNRVGELAWGVAAHQGPTLAPVLVLVAWFAGAAALASLLSRRLAVRG